MTSRLAIALVTLTAACALHRAPVVRSTPLAAAVHVGINDGFHGPLPQDVVAHYAAYGGSLTVRTPQLSGDGLKAFMDALGSTPFRVIALAEGPDVDLVRQFAAQPSGYVPDAIELGNELELPPHSLTQTQYAQWIETACAALRDYRGDVITGGVYALTEDTKVQLMNAHLACPRAVLGVHLYRPSQADVDWLNALDADVAVTETGSPTGCGTAKWQEQADYVAGVRALLAGVRRLKYFLVYQRPSGASCSDLDTFGIQSGSTWKPLDALLGEWLRR